MDDARPIDETRPATPRASPRTNLRISLTSFVGRDGDLTNVAVLLRRARLVTLVGPGGAGKTRLAVESAKAVSGDYPDGVWLVELAPVTDPAELITTMLTALGLREQSLLRQHKLISVSTSDPNERLLAALRDKRLLLVLDNCEHLIDDAARAAEDVLGKCHGITILATSREPLALTGETLWTVEPLALPPAGAGAEEAGRFAAVRLLADRGGAARPDFRVDAATVSSVVELCRALDGMPLAIELAAARLRTMTPAQIAGRLDDRFRLLVTGSRTALPRHQTLRAVVDWSWDLLDEAERTLLRRLSVFTGGASLAAAEAVTGLGEHTQELAHALVDKSLLTTTDGRFGMLETIRAYGRERLAEAGEQDAVRADYLDYFVRFAEDAEPHLRTREQVDWLARLAADHDNLHAALRLTIAGGDATRALRLVGSVGWYWWLGGHRAEGADLAQEALAMPGEVDARIRATAYVMGALNAIDSGRDFALVHAWVGEATRLTRTVADHKQPLMRLVEPLSLLINTTADGDTLAAAAGLEKLFDDPDPWTQATGRLLHAHTVLNLGPYHEQADHDLREALRVYTDLGERWGLAAVLAALAEQGSRAGQHEQALAWLTEALGHLRALGTREDVPQFLVSIAHELWLSGDREASVAVLDEAELESERLGVTEARASLLLARGEFARHRGDLDEADRLLRATHDVLRATHVPPQVRAIVSTARGYVSALRGRLDEAREHHAAALADAMYAHDAPILGRTVVGLAHLALIERRPRTAAVLLGAAAGIRGAPDQSLIDLPELRRAAREALGDDEFAEAYRHGLTHTTVTDVTNLLQSGQDG